jgi:peptidoglycan/xylan/chitin deacetylase (PgdA/CDA1 family)
VTVLRVAHPPGYGPERQYAARVLLGELIGLEVELVEEPRSDVELRVGGGPERLLLQEGLFAVPEAERLTERALPVAPFALVEGVPLLYGSGGTVVREHDVTSVPGDLLGSAFFLLTRLEEAIVPDRDGHDRFPLASSASVALLDRPLVDEYAELLWHELHRLWPRSERRPRAFAVAPTHDVDWPRCPRHVRTIPRRVAGDVLARRDPNLLLRRLRTLVSSDPRHDLCNTFDYLMDESERRGLRSAFYFIADHTAGRLDGIYSLDDPWIAQLLRRIADRGHEIGLHPSYGTYQDAEQTARELERLRRALELAGVEQEEIGGRQHFLRWANPHTWRNWEQAGLAYDSTLAFAESPGFRCGTAREFPVFDVEERRQLALRERPLIAMEVSLLQYQGLAPEEAGRRMATLRETCRRFGGRFTFLWHNDRLADRRARHAYEQVLGPP